MEASHTASCSSRTEPSQIITTVNTPSHQIRFEFNRSESKEPLGHCDESIHSPHDTAKVNRGSPQALLGPREATKQSVVEASTAPEDLVLIFGEEGAKGVIHVLSDFTFYQVCQSTVLRLGHSPFFYVNHRESAARRTGASLSFTPISFRTTTPLEKPKSSD